MSRPLVDVAAPTVEVFVDEGKKASYLLCAAIVPAGDIAEARRIMRAIKPRNKNRIHMQTEGKQSRQRILADFCRREPIREAYLWIAKIAGRPERDVRDRCFHDLVPGVVDLGARRVVVEFCSQDVQDKRVMTDALAEIDALDRTRVDVLPPTGHELLWAADLIAWCYGAGGIPLDAQRPGDPSGARWRAPGLTSTALHRGNTIMQHPAAPSNTYAKQLVTVM